MRIPKKTAVMITTAAAVSALGALNGPAQATGGDHKGDSASSHQSQPARAGLRPDRTPGARDLSATPASRAALATVEARVRGYVARHGTSYTFGTYADPGTGRLMLDTDAPARLVTRLTSVRGTSARAHRGLAPSRVLVHRTRTSDTYSRRDDVPAFYGGGGLLASNALCSTGYAVQTAAGNRWMVSAGHCYAVGTSVNTESNLRAVGTVTNRALPTLGSGAIDMELLYGQSYAGRVLTGGVTSSSSIPVVAAGAASVGYTNYCHSGRTTGEQCGHTATSTTAQVCTATGCKSPVIAYTGGVVQQGGDSGGAFYAKGSTGAWIRGHVIAGSSSTGYVEPWTQVAARYGVSIVTG